MIDTEYEHAGEWDCDACGETFEVEHKLDVLAHSMGCGIGSENNANRAGGHDGYRRRKRELEQFVGTDR
ncbi:hypothetical protein [Natronorubrum texcoconense]|uniref:C2H2-type domain-containing protein n=1 Tax=Natronorubrum texcoconense TaxID=1095776 RepID=A0A1G9HAJ8_9EURY|nr:hypothetical protein [Natronorubrum texcoconense]SDL10011.1 hypothetical protein SAMN04515672_0176 [Natronorubrum texcoconense]